MRWPGISQWAYGVKAEAASKEAGEKKRRGRGWEEEKRGGGGDSETSESFF
jgi:hypothetical protein